MKTKTISIQKENLKEASRTAGRWLRQGKLVAFPTETVYGLGVHLENPEAVQRLYEVKGRPKEKALTLAIWPPVDLAPFGVLLSPSARELMERFWPGPLTLLLRKENGEKIGVRMPGHPIAQAVLAEAGVPIGLPSANPSGAKPPCTAEEVLAYFEGKIDLVLDGGKTDLGTSSTMVDLTGDTWRVLREGTISKQEIEAACRSVVP